jgi:hypothetical protein
MAKINSMEDQYGQLIEPSPVTFSFGAPGWYVLGIVLILLLLFIAWLLYRDYKRNLYRRYAIKELTSAQMQYAATGLQANILYETNMLLKRIAMARYGRNETAGLRGTKWISFLNRSSGKELFTENDTGLLSEQLYMTNPPQKRSTDDFVEKAKQWIKKHKRLRQ